MKNMIGKLTQYGADVTSALERVLNDEKLYLMLIDEIHDEESFPALEKAIEEKNYDAAFEYAHTIKGVAGNLGLTPLYSAVCPLVEALRYKEYELLDKSYESFRKARDEFFELI